MAKMIPRPTVAESRSGWCADYDLIERISKLTHELPDGYSVDMDDTDSVIRVLIDEGYLVYDE